MRHWYLGAITIAAIALGNACSSNGPTVTTTTPPSLQDEYEPVNAIPATGGLTQITFDSSGTYFLKRTIQPATDEALGTESGTFALDLSAGTLTLTPSGGGAARTLPFQVGLTGTPAGSSGTSNGLSLHPQGLGSTIIHLIISFLLDGQWFHTDTPSVPDSGVDDAGWPMDDGSVAADASTPSETGCPASDASTAPPTSSGNGIDVSRYQGAVDWTSVVTARNFAYAKATEGTGYTDSKFATNWQGMQAAGIQRGAYHFFRASKDAVAQADHFISVLQSNGFDPSSDLAPMLDVEVMDGVDAGTVTTGIRAFLDEAQTILGATLVLYTGPSFWTHQLGNPDFSTNPLWIAHYTKAAHPTVPSSWPGYTIWQYSESDSVPGVAGGVDGDRWNGAAPPPTPSDAGMSPSPCGGFDAGDAGDAGLIPGTCTHDVCTAGTALGQACTSCTMVVCANDPYCCDTFWGLSCFPDVQQYCGVTCP